MRKITIACLLLGLAAGDVWANQDDTGFFIGVQLASATTQENANGYNFEESGLGGGLILGGTFTPNLAVEGNIVSFSYNNFVTHSFSVAPKMTFWLSDELSVYGKFGLSYAFLYSGDESWASWDTLSGNGYTTGVGANFAISQSTYIRASYELQHVSLEDWDGQDADMDFDIGYAGLGIYFQY